MNIKIAINQSIDGSVDPASHRERQQLPSENMISLHNSLIAKHSTISTSLWQTPTVAFMAQAFLLTIALGRDVNYLQFERNLAGFLSVLVGLISWQLFIRHHAFEVKASKDLEEFESKHFGATVRSRIEPETWGVGKIKSHCIWKMALLVFSFVGLTPVFRLSWAYVKFHWICV